MIVAVDFDGTIVEHEFSQIGPAVPYALHWLDEWRKAGATIILWTVRSNGPGERLSLSEAICYCRSMGFDFDGYNESPGQESWTNSPKAYAHVYVDDAGFGCPLIRPEGRRPYVDWTKVGPEVLNMIVEAG